MVTDEKGVSEMKPAKKDVLKSREAPTALPVSAIPNGVIIE